MLQYAGAVIGFVNKILLFTNYLSEEEVGLANILVTNAMLWANLSAMGFSTMTLRFFPYFQDKDRKHHNFLFWLLAVPTIGFLVVSFLVLVFQIQIFDYFQDKSPLMVEYFWYLIPLALATLYFDLFDAYLRSLMKTVVPVLFREIIQRIFVALSILLYALDLITFPQFVLIYVALLSSVTLLMVLYTWWLGHLHLQPQRTWRVNQLARKVLVFGGFTLMGNISAIILYNIDSLMLARYLGMDAVGIYTTCFYVTALIMIPWRAIQKVSAPKVAAFWKNNDMLGMQALYRRTSLMNLGVGLFLFFSMVCLNEFMFLVMPKGYREGIVVLWIVGATRVLDMLTGLNGYIMLTSKYYRLDLLMNAAMVILATILNVVMIPVYGIEGAAWATAIALALSNLFRIGFLWVRLGLHPFSNGMINITLVTAVSYAVFYLLYSIVPGIWGTVVGYGAFLLLFLPLTWALKVIPDANGFVKDVWGRLRAKL